MKANNLSEYCFYHKRLDYLTDGKKYLSIIE